MRNRILFLLCFLCIGLQAFAQISISGKVVDAGGLELPGVNVIDGKGNNYRYINRW